MPCQKKSCYLSQDMSTYRIASLTEPCPRHNNFNPNFNVKKGGPGIGEGGGCKPMMKA